MKMLNGYANLEVTLLNPEALANWDKTVFDMAKTTWGSLDGVVYDPENPEHQEMVWGAFEGRVLPTVLETIRLNFLIKGMSRTCSHQFVRGRVGWVYNQQSQMPEPVRRDISIPAHMYANPEFRTRLEAHFAETASLYDDLIAAGYPPQSARYVLPEGSNTDIWCEVTFPAFRGFVGNRTCFSTNDEINFVARMMRAELVKVEPRFAKYLKQACDRSGKCTLVDKVFPCCTKYEWPNPHKPSYGNKQNNAMIEMYRRPELAIDPTDTKAASQMMNIHVRDLKFDSELFNGERQ